MTAPTLLLVGGAGPAPLGVDIAEFALDQARSRGLHTILLNQAGDLPETIPACLLADEVVVHDFEDVPASVRWARDQVAAGRPLDIVFCLRELPQVVTGEVAAALGVAGNPPEILHRVRTKDVCRQWLAAAGFPQPSVTLCPDLAAAEAAVKELDPPWVVKPRDGSGSEGVSLVTEAAKLEAAVSRLPEEGPFLLEEFVTGVEFSVEGLFQEGQPRVLAVTAKDKLPPPYFVELGHTLPADIPEDTRRTIEHTVTEALRVLELRSGLFHAELWLTEDGVVLGELHGRLGGDYLHRMLAYARPGLEMFGLVFDDALGRPAVPPPELARAASSRYFTAPPGRLVAIEGLEKVVNHPDVLTVELAVRPGDVIPPAQSSDDRVGAVVVGADTAPRARDLAVELAAAVRFVVDEAAGAEPDGSGAEGMPGPPETRPGS